MAKQDYFRSNNFDLIRLVAATQVMLFHAIHYLEPSLHSLKTVVGYLPGVPAFFFVSGLLISASWERHSELRTFAINRALRIFPALWAVLAFSLLTLALFYDPVTLRDNLLLLGLWSISQVTILQDWIPDFMRGYGIGGMNGSLWTIPVELSFYAATPLIYRVARHFGGVNRTLVVVAVLSFTLLYYMYAHRTDIPVLAFKLLDKSPLPWIGMFCCGVVAQRHLPMLHPWIAGRAPVFALIYALVAALSHYVPAFPLLEGNSNSMGIINYVALCGLILSAAYTHTTAAERLLRRNDISYGIYIFHIPVINALVQNSITGWMGLGLALAGSVALATGSWFLVEKPALGLRHWALYRR